MGIFENNIKPSAPAQKNWNNVGYDMWMEILNENHYQRYAPNNMWFSTQEDAEAYKANYKNPWQTKNQIKNSYRNRTRLGKHDMELLNEVIQRTYSKYGVWLKYRIQFGKNGRIKSIYFVRFC